MNYPKNARAHKHQNQYPISVLQHFTRNFQNIL